MTTMNWITGMSRLSTANTRPWPIPGKLNTYSTTTMPPARYRKFSPITWIVGAIAFGSAWTRTICHSGTPFSRAIST